MKHPDEDTLLKSILEILDSEEEVQVHIDECESCKKKYEQIKSQTNLLKNYEPEDIKETMPLPAKKEFFSAFWIKAAAILIIGIIMGYFTATQFITREVNVVEQNLITKPLSNPVNKFTPCEQVDL